MKFIRKHRNIYLRIIDIIIIAISYCVAQIIIGNQLVLQPEIGKKLITTIIMAIIIYGGILEIFKTYKNITRYENGNDYLIYVLACLISCTIMIFFNVIPVVPILDERTNLIASLIIVTSIIGYRVFIRLILNEGTTSKREKEDNRKNVLVIGAGEATKILLTTIKNSMKDTYKVVGLIDDNENKLNYAISGNKILGNRYDIPKICREKNV